MQMPSLIDDFTLPPLEWHARMREWCQTMRTTQPVYYDEQNKCWRLFRYDDITRVQNDYKTFSSEPDEPREANSIIAMDPPRHRQLRSLVTPAFSARTIAQMAPNIASIVTDLLQKPLTTGTFDAVDDLAIPLPMIVIANLLGMPRELWPKLKQLSDAQIANLTPLADDEAAQEQQFDPAVLAELSNYLNQSIEERRQHPRDDVLSTLIHSEVDGERLSMADLYGFFFTLLIAGNITTTQLIGNAFQCFDAFPEAWQALRQDPQLVPSAIEEILRYLPPNRGTRGDRIILGGRLVKSDVQIGDVLLKKNDTLLVTTISANFDEQQFPQPERFDIQRNPNRHISFGHGIHYCLGAPLARLEAKVAMETLLKLTPNWQRADNQPLEQLRSHLVFGVRHMPLVIEQ